ncbi:hypothetical protein Poli38472_007710 [Pythium oligandrum]|uniref:Uncharacterized protein n=1 Tax=Pythium oligandrum TaxID=41045 RepID=A0A8K1FRY5_PYTOL|nr:hypothetical protein Poli38472_007710 [Pythium oligandrum]|eukprot:TMW68038.1 hypothetical protein Poli38472_007710 [Pythium oligandrum]
MEASLKVNAQERDSKGRLKNPFLRAASQFPRYKLDDARTQDPNAYSAECMPAKTTFYGVEAKFDDITGDLLTSGLANGSVILELNEWTTHSLSTMTLAILAAEVYDYPVSLYSTEATLSTTERMSSAPAGLCTPTHVNLEVWPGMEALLQVYANESSVVGPIGYVAQSGLYTTIDFVKDSFDYVKYSELLNADFWRSYTVLDKLIDSVSYADFASSAYFPTGNAVCTDNTMGCQNYCFKSNACKLREANGKNCIVVIMMSPNWDPGYLQASMSNVGMPAYFCFLGFGGTQNYVLAMQQANKPVLFYHYEPELFHFNNPGLFQRVTSSNSRTSQVEQGHFRRERLWRTY